MRAWSEARMDNHITPYHSLFRDLDFAAVEEWEETGADGEEGVLVVQEWREVEKGRTPRPKEPQAGKKWIQILGLQNVDAITKVMDEAVE
jgi:hypothetical protein